MALLDYGTESLHIYAAHLLTILEMFLGVVLNITAKLCLGTEMHLIKLVNVN